MDISSTLNQLLTTGINKKNYIIVVAMIICAVLYFLGVDINFIKNIAYLNIFLLIIILLYDFITGFLTFNKLDDLSNKENRSDEVIDILEKSIEDNDYIKDKIEEINNNIKDHDKRLMTITSDISNKPNLTITKTIVNYQIKNMYGDIFNECVSYTLLTNDNNNDIALANLKTNINDIIKHNLNKVHNLLKNFEASESLSDKIRDRVYDCVDVIITDIQKDKKINEKLYIINCILTESRKEIKKETLDFLREIQTKIFG